MVISTGCALGVVWPAGALPWWVERARWRRWIVRAGRFALMRRRVWRRGRLPHRLAFRHQPKASVSLDLLEAVLDGRAERLKRRCHLQCAEVV
jgi:hypothetical protein